MNTIAVFVTANCMTFNPLLNFPRPHKVGDWIKDLDGRTTREPIQPSLYAVIKFCTASQPPLTNSDLSDIGIWSVQDIGKNGSNLNKRDSGDFWRPFHERWIFKDWLRRPAADVWRMKTSGFVWKFWENWSECMNMARGQTLESCQSDVENQRAPSQ